MTFSASFGFGQIKKAFQSYTTSKAKIKEENEREMLTKCMQLKSVFTNHAFKQPFEPR